MGVQAKRLSFHIEVDLTTGCFQQNFAENIRLWMINNGIEVCDLKAIEVVDWDKTKMRNFFHGVVVPWFIKKYNESHSAEQHGIFKFDTVKDFMKAKFLGFERSEDFMLWADKFDLLHRPEDMDDWLKLTAELKKLRIWDRFKLRSTEELSAESYWNLLNTCESYAVSVFQDVYPLAEKPVLSKGPDEWEK